MVSCVTVILILPLQDSQKEHLPGIQEWQSSIIKSTTAKSQQSCSSPACLPPHKKQFSKDINMQFEKEIGVEYFDRVVLVIREKDKGEMVQRGADNSRNIICICHSDSGRCWLSGHCAMQEILRAYILQWPSGVSEDG